MNKKDKELIIEALELADCELHTQIALMPDVNDCAADIAELEAKREEFRKLLRRLQS